MQLKSDREEQIKNEGQ